MLNNDQTTSAHESSNPKMVHVADNGTLNVNAGYASAKDPGAAAQRAMNILVLLEMG
jgi:hypothetical protein